MICLRMWKSYTAKTPLGDFKVTTLENPLLSKQAVTSKGSQYLILTYSWTLTPIPNWTCSVVTISLFQCTAPSTWLNQLHGSRYATWSPTREGCWLMMKIMKLLSLKTLWCKNTVASWKEWRIRAKLGFRLHSFSHLCKCALVQLL